MTLRTGRTLEGAVMRRYLLVLGAAGVLISGYIHYYLYLYGGYRGIMPESFAGLTISRAFLINAIAGLVIAEMLVIAFVWDRLAVPVAMLGVGFAVSTLAAYVLTRTTGLLGFSDGKAITEAVIAGTAEIVALASLAVYVLGALRSRRTSVVQASS